jgi:hypothetical protein
MKAFALSLFLAGLLASQAGAAPISRRASAASPRLSLSLVGDDVLAGEAAHLHIAIHGALPRGARLELRSGHSTRTLPARTGTVSVIQATPGEASYQVLVLAGRRVVARSTLTLDWASVPGGYFTLNVNGEPNGLDYAEFSGSINEATCNIYACVMGSNDGDGLTLTGHTGSDEEPSSSWPALPPDWKISILVNGAEKTCVANSPETQCAATITVPEGEEPLTLTGVITSPTGKSHSATLRLNHGPVQEL